MKIAFATNPNDTGRVTEAQDGSIFVAHVDKAIPPQVRPLAQVKDKAVAAWQGERKRETVQNQAEQLAAAKLLELLPPQIRKPT